MSVNASSQLEISRYMPEILVDVQPRGPWFILPVTVWKIKCFSLRDGSGISIFW
jgi:hypothetical protein